MDDPNIIELYFGRDERALAETSAKCGAYLAVWRAIPPARPDSLRAFVCRIALGELEFFDEYTGEFCGSFEKAFIARLLIDERTGTIFVETG